MLDIFINKTVSQIFHIDKNEGEPGIVYEAIVGKKLMVKLGQIDHFKLNLLE